MRLTILINGSDPTVNHDYAVLWLDTEQHRWSREAHEGVHLPPWGELRDSDGVTALCEDIAPKGGKGTGSGGPESRPPAPAAGSGPPDPGVYK